MPQIAIVAALPREIVSLVRGVSPDAALLRRKIHLYRLPGAIVVAAGMGQARVSFAVEAVLAAAPIATLISAGLAGACIPQLKPGDIAEPGTVIDARTGERFITASSAPTILASVDSIVSVSTKRRLAETYPAALVDMEAATVARLAAAHGLCFRAIKAISDAHDFELAGLNQFSTPQGEFRTAAFALHTAVHPGTWSKAIELGRNSTLALRNLHARLLEVIAAEPIS